MRHSDARTQPLTVRTIAHSGEWNAHLAALPTRHVLQTWEWGQFKGRWGWTPRYLLFESGGRPRAAALVLRRALPRLGLNVLYVPKGPALDCTDTGCVESVLAHLESLARAEKAIFVKIDPDCPQPAAGLVDLAAAKESLLALLQRRGWRFSSEQVQFRNTIVLDLAPSEDELLATMKPKTRYNIRLAAKKGVSVRAGEAVDLDLLYTMYAETARRDGFVIRPPAYYHDAWSSFMEAGLARPFIAEVAGEPVAGLIVFRFGSAAWYMYGMSREAHRDKMPNHLLQWEAIRWLKSQGCATYDWWGAPDQLSEADRLWGVYRFKQGFGGAFTAHIGAHDFPASKRWYWLYTVAMPRILDAMRRRQRVAAGA